MNNRIIAAIIIVIVVAGGAYWISQNKSGSEVASDSATADTKSEVSSENLSIKSLIDRNGDYQCTFSTEENGVKSSGTVYTSSGKKMRGDFDYTVDGKQNTSHMVYDGSMAYMWQQDTKEGFKMSLDATEAQKAQDKVNSTSVDPNKNFKFDCKKWSVDASKLQVPTDVKFTDLSAMMGAAASMQNAGAAASASGSLDTKEAQQAVCNSLSEPAKSACLKAMQ